MREHPEDRRNRIEAEYKAITDGPAILLEKIDELMELILIYSDEEAKEELEKLREWFWAEELWRNKNVKKK